MMLSSALFILRCHLLQRTALHWSAAFNNLECVKLLIKYGINIALTDTECKTPLHWAANNHDPSTVQTMAAILVSFEID